MSRRTLTGGVVDAAVPIPARERRLAINRLRERRDLDRGTIDRFLARHTAPIIEGRRCTFLYRGEADEVALTHSVVGLPGRMPLRRLDGSDLWSLIVELPERSRVEYKLEVVRGGWRERIDDPLNPNVSHNPFGTNSVCYSAGHVVPDWTRHDPDSRPGELEQVVISSRALRRDQPVTVYRPARFRRSARYPLLVVHDGADYLRYAAMRTVLDNLLHRLDVRDVVVAFTSPGDRLAEYPNSARHARFLTHELVPRMEADFPLIGQPWARCLLGSSFGGVAALSVAARAPGFYGSLVLQSGSFVFTDIGDDHGGGPAFDPVVKFVNGFRARPRRVVDRAVVTCGVYEPLIVPNRSMVPVLESTGMDVRYLEVRDGHNWESWRDQLRDALAWVYPGPHKLYYE